jgi:hypothetical protein
MSEVCAGWSQDKQQGYKCLHNVILRTLCFGSQYNVGVLHSHVHGRSPMLAAWHESQADRGGVDAGGGDVMQIFPF